MHKRALGNIVVMAQIGAHPKPFFGFKCVSKSWLALSSRPFRLNGPLQPTFLGFFYETPQNSPFNIGFTIISLGAYALDATLGVSSHHDQFRILDCCNGLVLVTSWNSEPSLFTSRNMYVYNLATRQRTSIELLPEVATGGNLECVFKIAQNARGTFLHGRVHRVTEGHEIVSVDPNNTCLVTKFDLPGLSRNGISEVGQSQGLLHFMYVNKSHRLSIWVPKNGDLQNWILKHQLSLQGMQLVNVSFQNIKLHPGKEVIFVRGGGRNGRILSIDLTDDETNNIISFIIHPALHSGFI